MGKCCIKTTDYIVWYKYNGVLLVINGSSENFLVMNSNVRPRHRRRNASKRLRFNANPFLLYSPTLHPPSLAITFYTGLRGRIQCRIIFEFINVKQTFPLLKIGFFSIRKNVLEVIFWNSRTILGRGMRGSSSTQEIFIGCNLG